MGGVVSAMSVQEPRAALADDDAPQVQAAVLPVVPVVPTPVPTTAAPSVRPSPSRAPAPAPAAPRPRRDAPVRAEAVTDPLGPPPGPQADVAPARTAAPADRYAFLVGVQDYRSPTHDTIGSAKDVRFIRQSLLDAGWLPGNIRTVVDEESTGAAVRAGMAWLKAKNVAGTFAFFHYSGHVKQLGGGTEALWPVDRDFVRDTQVTDALAGSAGRMWVDIAGCEAASFLPGLPSDRTLVTASSKGSEKSYEYPQWGESVWTGLLFDVGMHQGQADADADGRVTVGEALRYSTYYAQKITLGQRPHGRQTPQTAGDPVRGWTLDAPPA
ncbi:MAG: caspase family protein [Frankiales bacterium]|nr:caspase family protein [Frankiales bacterium]